MNQVVPMRAGGQVAAIIPQSIADVWQVAKGVVAAGLAPKSLGDPAKDDVVSAVAITIMAGAELGLKPMVSLRSFTVINGKPALYGDGLIAVIRMSGKASKVKTGCDTVDGKMVGWCEAQRSDTGESNRVEFSEDDAIRAGLWSPEPTKRGKVWRNGQSVWVDDAPNDSPWHRYPKRMLQWRAAGYCLRELFGDVLGGIRDEFEEREIAEAEFYEVQPESVSTSPPSVPSPPSPPAAEDKPIIDEQPEAVTGEQDFDATAFFEELETALAGAHSAEDVEEAWTDLDVESTLDGDEVNREIADKMKARALKRIEDAADLFPGDKP